MRVTIIRDDNRVLVDGEGHTVDCSDLPADVHAVQWVTDHGGEIEHALLHCAHCGTRSKKMNALFTDFAPYHVYVERWRAAKAEHDAKVAEALADAARQKH